MYVAGGWSYSKIETGESCLYRFSRLFMENVYKPSRHVDTILGSLVHEILEAYLKGQAIVYDFRGFPKDKVIPLMRGVVNFIDKILPTLKGDLESELLMRIRVTHNTPPHRVLNYGAASFAGKVDVICTGGKDCTIIDFKSTPSDLATFQMRVYSFLALVCFPEVQNVKTYTYVVSTSKFIPTFECTRSSLQYLFSEVFSRIKNIMNAYSEEPYKKSVNRYCTYCFDKDACSLFLESRSSANGGNHKEQI